MANQSSHVVAQANVHFGDYKLELEEERMRAGHWAFVAHQVAPLTAVNDLHVLERQLEILVVFAEHLVAVRPLNARIGVAHGAAAEIRFLALLHDHLRRARLGLLPTETCARVSGGAQRERSSAESASKEHLQRRGSGREAFALRGSYTFSSNVMCSDWPVAPNTASHV